MRGVAERTIDLRLELLRDDVLEPFGLGVNVVDVQTECFREIKLEQAVVSDDLERDFLTRRRERDTAVGLVGRESESRKFFDHRAGRGGRHSLRLRERRNRDGAAVAELVDLAQVVLDRFGQSRLRHRPTV